MACPPQGPGRPRSGAVRSARGGQTPGDGCHPNPGRRVLAWWLVRAAGLTQAEAGRHVSAGKNLVSLWCADIQKGRVKNRHVRRWAEELLAEKRGD